MFTFLQKLVKRSDKIIDIVSHSIHSTQFDVTKMTLSERKAWRTSALHKSIKDVFDSFEIITGMYRYQVVPMDDRCHHFCIMIDTTKHFVLSKSTRTRVLTTIEVELKAKTYQHYGVIVDGVYWRANETVDVFEQSAINYIKSTHTRSKKTIADLHASFKETIPHELIVEVPQNVTPLTDEEAEAFKYAVELGRSKQKPSNGDLGYDTTVAPLK